MNASTSVDNESQNSNDTSKIFLNGIGTGDQNCNGISNECQTLIANPRKNSIEFYKANGNKKKNLIENQDGYHNGIGNGFQIVNGIGNGCQKETIPNFTKYEKNLHEEDKGEISGSLMLLAALSAIGGFLFGYNTSVVSGAMLIIRDEFNLTDIWHEGIVAITVFTAWAGSLVAGPLADSFGRRPVILLSNTFYMTGTFLTAMAMNQISLLIGRAILGMGIGLCSMAVPIYLSEVSPDSLRGRMTVTNIVFLTGGQFVATLVCGGLATFDQGWRWMLGIGGFPAIIQFAGFIFAPESPRWLTQRGRLLDARRALNMFRSADNDLDAELKLYESVERNPEFSFFSVFRSGPVRKALFLGCLLMFSQQVSGVNAVMYYSASIMKMSGVSDDSLAMWFSAGVAFFNFFFTLVGLYLVEHVGRRTLTLTSLVGMALALLALGGSFQLIDNQSMQLTTSAGIDGSNCSMYMNCGQCTQDPGCGFCYDTSAQLFNTSNSHCLATNMSGKNKVSLEGPCSVPDMNYSFAYSWCPSQDYVWLSVVGMCIFISFYAPGIGCLPWTINSEIYPHWARATCMSLATSVNWATNLAVSLSFLTIIDFVNKSGAFYMFMFFCMLSFTIFFFILPETRGILLEEVETVFEKPLAKNFMLSTKSKAEREKLHNKQLKNGHAYQIVEAR